MIVNWSEAVTSKYYNQYASRTPNHRAKKAQKKQKMKSSKEKQKKKLSNLLEINKKFERDVIDFESSKLRSQGKYSPKNPKRLQYLNKDISANNKSLAKIKKSQSPSKQSLPNLKKAISEGLDTNNVNFTLLGQKFTQPKIIEKENSLLQIQETQILISKVGAEFWQRKKADTKKGYWVSQNKYVTLFPVSSRSSVDKIIVVNQPHILPILGSVTMKKIDGKKQRYIATDIYENSTLRDLLLEFGALDQNTLKLYLRKLILCIWNLHKNKIAHNRLSLDSIIHTENGDILVNMLKSSTRALGEEDKYKRAYDFPPEILLSKINTNPQKNDIWAIGCITMELLTNYEHKSNYHHPYNKVIHMQTNTAQPFNKFKFLSPLKNSHTKTDNQFMMKDSHKLLEKVQRMIESQSNSSKQSIVFIDMCESMEMKELSPLALDFIKKCLTLKLSKRPSIDELMFHPFLKSS